MKRKNMTDEKILIKILKIKEEKGAAYVAYKVGYTDTPGLHSVLRKGIIPSARRKAFEKLVGSFKLSRGAKKKSKTLGTVGTKNKTITKRKTTKVS